MKRPFRLAPLLLATVLTACSYVKPGHSTSGKPVSLEIVKSESDRYNPTVEKAEGNLIDFPCVLGGYESGSSNVTYNMCAIRFSGSQREYYTIVNFDLYDGMKFAFAASLVASHSCSYVVGQVNTFAYCISESKFETVNPNVVLKIYLSDDFLETPREVFFDIILVEYCLITAITSVVLYPYEKIDGAYNWRIEEIGGYRFPEILGIPQNRVKESHTEPLFKKIREDAKEKYYPGVINGHQSDT